MDYMRKRPQKTVIGAVRDALHMWAQREGWKHATLVQTLVDVHYREGLDRLTGVDFARDGDPARLMKTNAERVMRWLDDQTKDTTLMPANLLRTVMAALPLDLRHWLANEVFAGVGLTVSLQAESDALDLRELVVRVVKEGGEAHAAVAELAQRVTPLNAKKTVKEIDEAMAELSRAREEACRHIVGEVG